MPRPLTGSIRERPSADGHLAYYVRIRDRQVLIGHAPDVRRSEVEALLKTRLLPMAQLGQAWWDHAGGLQPQAQEPTALVVADILSDYHRMICARYDNRRTRDAYLFPIEAHVGPFFAYDGDRLRTVDELTGPLVAEFIEVKRAEREILCDLPDTLAELDDATLRDPDALREQLDVHEWRMLMRYGQRGGGRRASDPQATGRFSISTRGLSSNEINRCLNRLRDAIRLAEDDHDLVIRDPTARRRPPREEPDRTWLMPDALQALLDAARDLDSRRPVAETDGLPTGRYDLIACLGLAGPRNSELCAFTLADLRSEGLRVADAKTAAGRRVIELHPLPRKILETRRREIGAASGLLFPSGSGGRRDRHAVRRLLGPVAARANELLAQRGQDPLPERITPHTFRRTYLTYLYWAGHPINFAQHQAGHRDARMLLEIYQQKVPRVLDPRVAKWVERA